jgi:hypothetical protein
MLTIGIESASVAAGIPPTMTRLVGRTFRVAGAAPNEHCSVAPAQTCGVAMVLPRLDERRDVL